MKDGKNDAHLGLAGGEEAGREGFAARIPAHGGDGREIEFGAERRSGVADMSAAPNRSAAGPLLRDDAQPGGHGARILEMAWDFGGEQDGGFGSDAWNGLQTADIILERRLGLKMSVESYFQALQLGFEKAHGALQAGFKFHDCGSRFEAAQFTMKQVFEIIPTPGKLAERVLSFRQGLPESRRSREGELCDKGSVHAIGFIAAAFGAGKIEDASGVKDRHGMAGGEGCRGYGEAVGTGGLQGDERFMGADLAEKSQEFSVARLVVGDPSPQGALVGQKHTDIESGLGNVDADDRHNG